MERLPACTASGTSVDTSRSTAVAVADATLEPASASRRTSAAASCSPMVMTRSCVSALRLVTVKHTGKTLLRSTGDLHVTESRKSRHSGADQCKS